MTMERLEGMPAGVLGFRGVGVVTAADYRGVFTPAIMAAVAAQTTINIVYVLDEEFDRYSVGAAWQDALLEGTPAAAWGRAALVTDNQAMTRALPLLAPLFPGELHSFTLSEREAAVAWVAASPEPEPE